MNRLTPPIRFVASILTLWIGVRLAFWMAVPGSRYEPFLSLPGIAGLPDVPAAQAEPESPILASRAETVGNPLVRITGGGDRADGTIDVYQSARRLLPPAISPALRREQMRLAALMPPLAQPMLMRFARRPLPADTGYHNRAEEYSPWRFAFWAQWRSGDGPRALAEGGELGGSQAGARLQYSLGRTARTEVAATARISRPLEGSDGAEAAVGLIFRPSPDFPLELFAERRIRLERGGRNAWSLGAATGINRQTLPFGFELDGYAQAGVVGAERRDFYVDANIAVARPIEVAPRTTLSVGGAAWAAAQPGASRVDIGPEAVLRLPAGEGGFRLSVSWRERVAGSATPGSGPAIALGADF